MELAIKMIQLMHVKILKSKSQTPKTIDLHLSVYVRMNDEKVVFEVSITKPSL